MTKGGAVHTRCWENPIDSMLLGQPEAPINWICPDALSRDMQVERFQIWVEGSTASYGPETKAGPAVFFL